MGTRSRARARPTPVKRGRVYRGSRAEFVWTAADETTFLAKAPAHLHLPLTLALWTGQRQGDPLRLSWTQYDGSVIRLQQSIGKLGQRMLPLILA
jgi:integrase